MTVRVYEDGFVEGDETVIIDLSVNANGGDAVANTALNTYIDHYQWWCGSICFFDQRVVLRYGKFNGWQALDDDGDGK